MRRFVLVMLVGCGRIGFDAVGVSGNDGHAIDGAPPTSGLVAWWKLDEGSGTTVADSIGTANGDFGSYPLVWTTGVHGNALAFMGNGDYVTLGTPASITNLPAITISAWIRPSSIAFDAPGHCFFDKGNVTNGWAFDSSITEDGDLAFYNDRATTLVKRKTPGGALTVGAWQHVAATWDGSSAGDGIHIYVNGVEQAYELTEGSPEPRTDDSPTPAGIGCINAVSFAGTIDDMKIFNRALTPAEIVLLDQ